MPLFARILRYLSRTPGTWVPYDTLYALARQHGYAHDVITDAITRAKREVNVGSEYVDKYDYRTKRTRGSYLVWYDMPDEDRVAIRSGVEWFDQMV